MFKIRDIVILITHDIGQYEKQSYSLKQKLIVGQKYKVYAISRNDRYILVDTNKLSRSYWQGKTKFRKVMVESRAPSWL